MKLCQVLLLFLKLATRPRARQVSTVRSEAPEKILEILRPVLRRVSLVEQLLKVC